VPIEEEEDCHKKGLADSVPGDQKVSVHLTMKNSEYSKSPHTIEELKMAITEHIRNVYRAILNMVFENTVRRVKKFLQTGGGHFEHSL
jgi:predicted transcriptional regulator